jgi:hypothetical protein
MYSIHFYAEVVRALDDIDAPYMIVGAFAGLAFGITRTTFDIDILVDLRPNDCDRLSEKFPLPRFYADPEMMKDSIRLGIMFNLIDTQEGVKADLVPLLREPEYRVAFDRRIRRWFSDGETEFEAWCARPEDIIIGKLQAWNEGRSNKHPADIRDILLFLLSDDNDHPFDLALVEKVVNRMGSEVAETWRSTLTRARSDAKNRNEQ